jgi:tRNA threonylcarbamoyladenosine biosynthesis protein TsaB
LNAVIGFDTATADTAVAAVRGGETLYASTIGPAPGSARPAHVSRLQAEIESAAAAAGGWQEIGRIVVGVGPGSFTGLRVGVATARGLAQALELPLVAVSTVATIASGMAATEEARGRPRLVVIDARRNQAFAALYDPAGTEVWAPFVATAEQLAERLANLDEAPLAAGDGSLRFRATLEEAGVSPLAEAHPAHHVSAPHTCLLGAGLEPLALERVEPIYLRRPDAELWREQQRRRHNGA